MVTAVYTARRFAPGRESATVAELLAAIRAQHEEVAQWLDGRHELARQFVAAVYQAVRRERGSCCGGSHGGPAARPAASLEVGKVSSGVGARRNRVR